MKRIWFAFILLESLADSFAQGYVIFGNASSAFAFPDGVDRLVRFDATAAAFNPFGTNFAPAVSNLAPSLCAQLYYGPTSSPEGQLAAVTNAPATFRSSTSANAGAWLTRQVFVDIPLAGQYPYNYIVGNFQVRVWDLSLAPTYEAALADPNYIGLLGKSPMFTQTYSWLPFETGLTGLSSFTIGVVAEPSALALAGLAGGLLLAFGCTKRS